METKKALVIILAFVFCISVGFNAYLGFEVVKLTKQFEAGQQGSKVMAFRNMFTENVLLSNKEIDFETRLEMENAVRELKDQQILLQWQRFTESTTQEDASLQAKKLLQLLIQRTSK